MGYGVVTLAAWFIYFLFLSEVCVASAADFSLAAGF
jgi:hypothetical protein